MSATTDAPQAVEPLGLKQKLLLIRRGLKTLPKKGWNDHHKYRYVRSEDAVGKAQKLLDGYGVLLVPSVAGDATHNGATTLVPLSYTFEDVETGQTMTVSWLGAGQDKGDKGVYKAYTGALKFFLIQFFQIKVGDAPEPEATDGDGASTSRPAPAPKQAQAGGTVAKDADRAAATRIPRDRAVAILNGAKSAGLVNDDDSFSAVFKAKLADVGVSKIGQLDVDQAEAVEAFIREEALATQREAERAEA